MTSHHRILRTFGAAVLASSLAFAQPAADDLVKEGLALRRAGNDAAALAKFEQAYAAGKQPRALAQIALAEQALGRWVDAETHLTQALAAADDKWIADKRGDLREALAAIARHIGTLEISGGLPGAEVLLNGRTVGTLPTASPLRIAAGTWTLEVRAPDHYPVSRAIEISGGGTSREAIELRKRAASAASAEPASGPASVPPPPPPPPTAPPTSTSPASRPVPTSVIALGATGIAFAGVGVVALLVRKGVATEYNDDPACPGTKAASQPVDCQSKIDSAGRWQTISIVGFSASVVSLAVGGILLATDGKRESGPSARTTCSPGLGSFSCWGTF